MTYPIVHRSLPVIVTCRATWSELSEVVRCDRVAAHRGPHQGKRRLSPRHHALVWVDPGEEVKLRRFMGRKRA